MSQTGGLPEWNGVLPSVVQFPPPTAAGKGPSEVWVVKCKLCNGVTLESRTTWQQHFESKRHRNAARQQGLTPTGHRLDGANKNAASPPPTAVEPSGNGGKQGAAGGGGGGPPVPRSKVSPTAANAAPVGKNNNNSKNGGGDFDIAKSIAAQVGGKGGGGAAQAPSAGAPLGKTIMARPNAAGGGGAQQQQQGGWANPPTSVTSSATKAGKQQPTQQQQQQTAKKVAAPTANNSSNPTSGAASRQQSSVILADNVVNRDRLRSSATGTPAPPADDAGTTSPVASAGVVPPIKAVRATVGAPIVDPALDRAKGRSLIFLASKPAVTGTPVPASAAATSEQYKVTARLPTSLFRLLAPRADDLEATPAAGATDTVKAFREAFHELAAELGGFDSDPDGPGVTQLTANRPVPLATMRMAESFFNAAVCFAPYDEPGTTATATAARVDTASFWT